jgi:hypothetical protein
MFRAFPLRGIDSTSKDLQDQIQEYLKRSPTVESDILDNFKGITASFPRRIKELVKCLYKIPLILLRSSDASLKALVFGQLWWH